MEIIPGALYLAGFTQARSPHIGLLLAETAKAGTLFHIRIDRATSPHWQYQRRRQEVEGNMFLSSLLRISNPPLDLETAENAIEAAALEIPPPPNDEFGLDDLEELGKEVDDFSKASRAYARRDKFPNVGASQFCR